MRGEKFHVFVGQHYYPRGSAEDYLASFDHIESAIACVENFLKYNSSLLLTR